MANVAWEVAKARTRRMNSLEDEIAMEWYGCKYDELSYDEKEEVTFEMQDRMMDME